MSTTEPYSTRRVTTGDLIRSERARRGWTQAELAQAMGAEPHEVESLVRSIRRWESGVEPKRRALRRIALAFQVPVGMLVDDSDLDPTYPYPEDIMEQLEAARVEVARACRALQWAIREANQ